MDVIFPVYKTFFFPHSNSMLSPIFGRSYGVGETEADDDEAESNDDGDGETEAVAEEATGMNLI